MASEASTRSLGSEQSVYYSGEQSGELSVQACWPYEPCLPQPGPQIALSGGSAEDQLVSELVCVCVCVCVCACVFCFKLFSCAQRSSHICACLTVYAGVHVLEAPTCNLSSCMCSCHPSQTHARARWRPLLKYVATVQDASTRAMESMLTQGAKPLY